MKFAVAEHLWQRMRGLYGRKGFDGVLMLAPCKDVHTFAMKRPIDVAFVSSEGVILEAHRGVGPNRRLRNRRAVATLERFSVPRPWFEPGDKISKEVAR